MDYLLVGLGNPGESYTNTRHNVGRMVLERVHKLFSFSSWRYDRGSRAYLAQGVIDGADVLLAEPETYMNNSGESVAALAKKYPDAELVVLHDDLDLPLGEVKISYKRGAGGHRGVQSIIDCLKTKSFTRIRLGIVPKTLFGGTKKPRGEEAVSKFVLGRLADAQLKKLEPAFEQTPELVRTLVTKGREAAMQERH